METLSKPRDTAQDFTSWLLDSQQYQDELSSIQASEEAAIADLLLEQEEK